MGSNTSFSNFVHFAGANLNLDPFTIAARHCGVDRPIAVGLGLADIVLEPTGHRFPSLMDRAQRTVAIGLSRSDHAKPVNVGQPAKALLFFLHLTPDRKRLFCTAHNGRSDIRFFQLDAHIRRNTFYNVACFTLQRDKTTDDGISAFRVQDAECQIL